MTPDVTYQWQAKIGALWIDEMAFTSRRAAIGYLDIVGHCKECAAHRLIQIFKGSDGVVKTVRIVYTLGSKLK